MTAARPSVSFSNSAVERGSLALESGSIDNAFKTLGPANDDAKPDGDMVLWFDPDCSCADLIVAIQDCVAEGRFKGEVRIARNLEDVQTVLEHQTRSKVVLGYETAVHKLLADMAKGEFPAIAVRNWTETAHSILGILRRHRRNTVLVEVAGIGDDPAAFADLVGGARDAAFLPERASRPASDPVLTLLAAETIRRDPAALALTAELEARSTMLGSAVAADMANLDTAFYQYQRTLQLNAQLQDVNRAQIEAYRALKEEADAKEFAQRHIMEENELFRSQLQMNEAAFERASQSAAEAKRKIKSLEQRVSSAAKNMAELEGQLEARIKVLEEREQEQAAELHQQRLVLDQRAADLEEAAARATLLESQKRDVAGRLEASVQRAKAVERRLEGAESEVRKLRDANGELNAKFNDVKQELKRIRASKLFRIATPYRRIVNRFRKS